MHSFPSRHWFRSHVIGQIPDTQADKTSSYHMWQCVAAFHTYICILKCSTYGTNQPDTITLHAQELNSVHWIRNTQTTNIFITAKGITDQAHVRPSLHRSNLEPQKVWNARASFFSSVTTITLMCADLCTLPTHQPWTHRGQKSLPDMWMLRKLSPRAYGKF